MSLTVDIPTLETDRLRLRAWSLADADHLAPVFTKEAGGELIGGTEGYYRAWRVISMEVGHWALRGFGVWALEAKDDGRFIGFCGPWFPGDFPEPDLGWALRVEERGKGFATEAATAARDYLYSERAFAPLVSIIAPENAGSVGVAKRLGCTRESSFSILGKTVDLWRHPAPHQPH
ncbi:MAG: GNAT family N-acetyltransferase [Pseudomonadota bacterium]